MKPRVNFKSAAARFLALSDAAKDAGVSAVRQGRNPALPITPSHLGRKGRRWNRIRRGLGRPKIGRGSVIMPISIERGLLDEVNEFAAAHKLKRSQKWCREGLRLLMRRKAS